MDAITNAVILTTCMWFLYTGQILGTWWTRIIGPRLDTSAHLTPLIWITAGLLGRIVVVVPGTLLIGLDVSGPGMVLGIAIGTAGQIAGNHTPTHSGVIARRQDPDDRGPWSMIWITLSAGVIALAS